MDPIEAAVERLKASESHLVELPCGCQDVHYADGRIEREHDYVECNGLPDSYYTDDVRDLWP